MSTQFSAPERNFCEWNCGKRGLSRNGPGEIVLSRLVPPISSAERPSILPSAHVAPWQFYETLRIPATVSPAELRVAFKLRTLEVAGGRGERLALERAFNILGQPELRACYDALLADPEAPAIFPYGGFRSEER